MYNSKLIHKNLSKQTKLHQCFTDYATRSTYQSNITYTTRSATMVNRFFTVNEYFKID